MVQLGWPHPCQDEEENCNCVSVHDQEMSLLAKRQKECGPYLISAGLRMEDDSRKAASCAARGRIVKADVVKGSEQWKWC